MNELYLKDVWGYFKTNATNYDDAISALFAACDRAGIELNIESAILRDSNGNDIEG